MSDMKLEMNSYEKNGSYVSDGGRCIMSFAWFCVVSSGVAETTWLERQDFRGGWVGGR